MTTPLNEGYGPCYEQSQLFDSAFPTDHTKAKAICATCPLIDACRKHLDVAIQLSRTSGDTGPSLVGTWAGIGFAIEDNNAA